MTEHKVRLTELRRSLDEIATARDGSGHSIFSPSGSPMWLVCSGSLIPNILAPDEAGEDAAYGTVCHMLTEYQLKTGHAPIHRLGTPEWVESGDWGYLIWIDEEMLGYVQDAVDQCEWIPGEHFVEERVFFSEYTPLPKQSGTADHCAVLINPQGEGCMVITDHKFGKGVIVYAAADYNDKRAVIINEIDDSFEINGNPQGLLYALGFFLKWDHKYHFKHITIRISQPRLDHYDEWTTTREELLKFAEFVKVRSFAAWQYDAPRHPSPKGCLWCKIKADCAAWAVMQEDIVTAGFADLVEDISVDRIEATRARLAKDDYVMKHADLQTLTLEEKAKLIKFRAATEKWFASMADDLERAAVNGQHVPGHKLVETRSNRKFQKPAAARKLLIETYGIPKAEVVKESLVSPAQAEVLLRVHAGKKKREVQAILEPLVHRAPGAPTLVPEHDKRPALVDHSGSAFADLVNPETDETEEI